MIAQRRSTDDLVAAVERFFSRLLRSPGTTPSGTTPVVVGFSGGPDSLALLLALTRASQRLPLVPIAAHLDHGGDEGSSSRMHRAERLAAACGVTFVSERLDRPSTDARSEGLEAWWRRQRYEFLEACRQRFDARWIAVAHHRDDQVETVLLRLLYGSGLAGIGAMAAVRGRIVRPLLDRPRRHLLALVEEGGLEAIDDPGNADLRRPRNLVRERLRPALEAAESGSEAPGFETPGLEMKRPGLDRLARIARLARAASRKVDRLLEERLPVQATDGGADFGLEGWRALPSPLRTWALARLHRAAGAGPAPRRDAVAELERQLSRDEVVGCDCGDGWRWEVEQGAGAGLEGRLEPRLRLVRAPAGRAGEPIPFSCRLAVPGEVSIPEIGKVMRITRRPREPWMFEGSRTRAALELPLVEGDVVQIRNRRPGDRIRPLGCSYERKLKDVLIDRRFPREDRDALPLLIVEDRVAWVPGVTIDDRRRIRTNAGDGQENEQRFWVAELLTPSSAPSPSSTPSNDLNPPRTAP